MGEPLYNFDAVRDALLIVADNEGIGISRRASRVDLGVVPNIIRRRRVGVMLAICCMRCATSCATNWCRSIANIRSPIAAGLRDIGLLQCAAHHLEYVMLKGVNDSSKMQSCW
jgi:23S rRNA (adenine2503-C2)-methyltransferase